MSNKEINLSFHFKKTNAELAQAYLWRNYVKFGPSSLDSVRVSRNCSNNINNGVECLDFLNCSFFL